MAYVANVGMKPGLSLSVIAWLRQRWMLSMVYELRGTAMVLLMIIENAPANADGWHEVSYDEFIDRSQRHRSTVARALKLLKEKGLIEADNSVRGWHRKHRYKLAEIHTGEVAL
jgi:predicted transcriptional regulator